MAKQLSYILFLVVATGVLIAGHLLPVLNGTPVEFGIRDSLHIVVFAVFGLGLFLVLARFGTVTASIASLAAVAAIAVTAEIVQSRGGNIANPVDVVRDLAGAGLAIAGWLLWRAGASGKTIFRIASVVSVALIFAPLTFWLYVALLSVRSSPVIVSFDEWWEDHIIWAVNTEIERIDISDSVDLTSGLAGHFTLSPERRNGVSLFPGFTDWREFEYLAFTIAVANGPDARASLRINDGAHFRRYDGAYTHRFPITNEPVRMRFRLTELATYPDREPLDLSDIRQVTLLVSRGDSTARVMLDDIRLE